eukprot:4527124-Alexandrium_andersonii.AAC.1
MQHAAIQHVVFLSWRAHLASRCTVPCKGERGVALIRGRVGASGRGTQRGGLQRTFASSSMLARARCYLIRSRQCY